MIIPCTVCGARNRIDPAAAAGRQPVCGRCGAYLELKEDTSDPASAGKPVEVTDATFQHFLESAGDRPVLIDCWAAWCPPCRMLAPTMDALAAEGQGRWVIGKLDTDANPRTAGQFDIQSIPTMLIFRRGQLVDRLTGLQPKPAIEARLAKI